MGHEDNLAFFNVLSAVLEIELSEPTVAVAPNLLNQKATKNARIVSVSLKPSFYDSVTDELRELTLKELELVVLKLGSIQLRGEGKSAVEHDAPNGEFFTVRDLMDTIAVTERKTRERTEWCDGIDVHHIFFEGMELGVDGVWEVYWGS